MWRARRTSLLLAASCLLALTAFRSAKMEVPAGLAASTEAMVVSGHDPRAWNRPIAFGPYRTSSVREGAEFSWSVKAFGVRGGMASQPYRLVLEGPDSASWEVECRTRAIAAWRGGWSVELTDAFTPRLVCGLTRTGEAEVYRLILGSTGSELRGVVQAAGDDEGAPPILSVRSIHRLEGSRLPLAEPAGYVIERDGAAVAAVETINRGRVWLAGALDAAAHGRAAAAAAALLLYNSELSPEL